MDPISTRLTSSVSIGVFPTRSPIPIAAPWRRRRTGLERRQRIDHGEVPVAMAVPVDADAAAALVDDLTDEPHHRRRARRRGVADVSATQTRDGAGADRRRIQRRSVSGSARVVSSVTYITGRPSPTANAIASSVSCSSWSMVHPSAYCRSGLDPMKAQHSIGMPARCEISRDRAMSAIDGPGGAVRLDRQPRRRDLARQPLDVADDVRRRRRAGRCSAVSMPRRSMRCRIRTFCSIVGQRTEGDCSPSRSVSSSSITAARCAAPTPGSNRG